MSSESASNVTAIVNAGGRSSRMTASGIGVHKALVRVLGVPLVERNLCVLLSQGFRDIVVVAGADNPEVEVFARTRGALVASAYGADLTCVREAEPLGNVGVLRLLSGRSGDLLMTFVDNLTALDLRALVARHRESGAALTIASHVEPFRVPHGELRVEANFVTAYVEKPVKDVCVASGIFAARPSAAAHIPEHGQTGAVDLFALLHGNGEKILDFRHDSPWMDINDAGAVARAEDFVARYGDVFDRWTDAPQVVEDCLVVRCADRVLVAGSTATARFPGGLDVTRGDAVAKVERAVHDAEPRAVREFVAGFDDIDARGDIVRHRLHVINVGTAAANDIVLAGYHWVDDAAASAPDQATQPLCRSIALLRPRA